MNLHEKLQALRKEKGYSQDQLAQTLCVSRQAISKWENGATYPDIENLIQLSEFYEVSLDYLLKDKNISPKPQKEIFMNDLEQIKIHMQIFKDKFYYHEMPLSVIGILADITFLLICILLLTLSSMFHIVIPNFLLYIGLMIFIIIFIVCIMFTIFIEDRMDNYKKLLRTPSQKKQKQEQILFVLGGIVVFLVLESLFENTLLSIAAAMCVAIYYYVKIKTH